MIPKVNQIVVDRRSKQIGRISRIDTLVSGIVVITVLPTSGGSYCYHLQYFQRIYRLQNQLLRII